MSTDQDLDFSTGNIPESWHSAAAHAPTGAAGRVAHGSVQRMPSRTSADLFSAVMAATVVSGLTGLLWYWLESSATLVTPYTALAVGAAIALAVRAGAGPDDGGTRAILSLSYYLVTSIAVILLLVRKFFAAAYGSSPGLHQFEQAVLHSRFADPVPVACWVGGAVLAVQLSRMLRRRI